MDRIKLRHFLFHRSLQKLSFIIGRPKDRFPERPGTVDHHFLENKSAKKIAFRIYTVKALILLNFIYEIFFRIPPALIHN